MKITYKDKKFVAEATYKERLPLKEAKFRWNPKDKVWWTDDKDKVLKLYDSCDSVTKKILSKERKLIEKKVEESKATTSNMNIPSPEGLNYLDYQKAGIEFANRKDNVLIGDEMGLGKTIQAIGLCNLNEKIKNILIICPASLRINWKNEFQKWDVFNREVEIANSKFPDSNVVVINYDILKKYHKELRKRVWDIMIVDESHYLKNYKAKRTHEVLGKYDKEASKRINPIPAKKKVFLTGTPILNRPVELWTILNAIDSEGLGKSWVGYVTRYCDAFQNQYGWDVSGASNLEELQTKLRTSIMIRRLKKDVLKELPAKRRQVIVLPPNGSGSIVQKEKDAYDKLQEKLHQLKIAVELAKANDDENSYTEAIEKLRQENSIAFTEIAKIRHETAVAKIPFIIQYLHDSLESTDKVVVFAHHKDVINAIKEEFSDCSVSLTGGDKLENRQKAVDDFQNDKNVKIFIGSIKAAGVGITLTAASMVVFAELDWVPGNVTQAEDRLHRIGQEEKVNVYHLVFDDSLDAKMAKTIVEKQNIIDAALDEELKLEIQQIPVIPSSENYATENTTKKKIAKEAEEIKDEEVLDIHKKLRYLAGVCDGAQAIDGSGFNKFDTAIGKSLAGQDSLSKKQAVLGKKLVNKYKRQLI